jgi:hypothetical protein
MLARIFGSASIVISSLAVLAGPAAADGMKGYGTKGTGFTAEDTQSWVVFSGYDIVKDSNYSYQGAVVALNGDIGRDGFMLRLYGSQVGYEYDNGPVRTDGDGWQADAMIGYKVSRGRFWAAGYIGVDYQDYDLTPDDRSSQARGSEVGFKVAADMATLRTEGPLYIGLNGEYSTAFESYWTRARVGYNVPRVTFGPEFIAMGNVDFDAQRVGGFVTFDVNLTPKVPLEITLSGGHQFVSDDDSSGTAAAVGGRGGGEGAYGAVTVVSVF